MSDTRRSGAAKAVGVLAAMAAGVGARKLVTVGWKKVTGKEPPSDPDDPRVGIGEALSWAVVLGVAIETARIMAQRAATRHLRKNSASNGP
jgi:hypothetical protein